MMKFLLGLIIGLGVVPAVGFVYFRLGFTPVATAAPAMPFEKKLAAGARIYREYCAFCHGIAGQAETASPKGMFPHPPQLFKGTGVTDDPAGEIYWKIANGVRLTGMPGYRKTLTEDQMWQVSLLLLRAHELPAPAKGLVAQPTR
jgi:mono/diheme cytochrome c family protein